MVNKELLKKRFKKSLHTYDDNAISQKITAQKLVELLPERNYRKVFEIGCGSGILTQIIYKNFQPKEYFLNDIVPDCEKFIDKILPKKNFITGDIDRINISDKFDLIISNAALQWSDDINATVNKLTDMLENNGVLAFSTFKEDNLFEIKEVLNIGLNYTKPNERKNMHTIELEPQVLWFDSPKDVLKHLKLTGVNALQEYVWSKSKLKNFEAKYKSLFEKDGKVSLTYKPVCTIFEKLN